MNEARPWERSYPPSLRNYRLDEGSLPEAVDMIAAESRIRFGANAAFTVVLPDGLSTDLSFAAVDSYSDDFAVYLSRLPGLEPGDVIAIQLPNSLQYPIAVFGAWRAGLIITNVNPLYTARELRLQLQDSGAKVLILHSLSLATADGVADECDVRVIVANQWDFFPSSSAEIIHTKPITYTEFGSAGSLAAHTSFERALAEGRQHGGTPAVQRHPIAIYQYTGGTTGHSKGAVLTHRNLASILQITDDFTAAYDAAPDVRDVILTVIPLYHIFAFVVNFLMFFRKGARNVLVPDARPLANLRPAFEQFSISWMTGVDTLYAGLMAESWFQENPPKLRHALAGGAALKPTTSERWQQMVGPILEGYGMTETSCIISFTPPGADYLPGSVGLPMPGCDVRVVDAQGNPLAPGKPGELLVRGPHVTSGYLNRPDENAVAIVDGWLRTGDVVTMDADGRITILDRVKDMVLVSGFNVFPSEVEFVIAAHPDVAEVGVIGVPDEITGEAVCAFIVPRREELTADEVIAFCRTQLTAYKIPKQIRFLPQLPKSPVGKILRTKLRQAF